MIGGALAAETRSRNELPAGKGASKVFGANDPFDLDSLASKFAAPERPIDRWLVSRLSRTTRAAAETYRTATPAARDRARVPFRRSLWEDLGTILSGPVVYEADRFHGVTLRRETRTLLAPAETGTRSLRLNRLLLEDAYSELPTSAIVAPFVLDVNEASGFGVDNDGGNGRATRTTLGIPKDGKTLLGFKDLKDRKDLSLRSEDSEWQFWQPGLRNESLALAITREGHARGAGRVVAPQGVVVGRGASTRLVDEEWLNSIEARLAALERASSRSTARR